MDPETSSLLLDSAALGVELLPDQVERLRRFEGLLLERGVPLGLVAEADAGRITTRHILDCLRAAVAVEPGDRDAYDLGSGAGLPGVVVAIARPSLRVLLVESRRRRVAFLELVVQALEVANAAVVASRVEEVRDRVDLCFARAFASLDRSWRVAFPLLRPGGRLVYFAGESVEVPSAAPAGTWLRLLTSPLLESAGPLVIMAQQ